MLHVMPDFAPVDVVGVGENATDTILEVPRFPAFNSSTRVASSQLLAGGQVATAMVACQLWGLQARYFGKVGDDAAGEFQRRELAAAGVEAHLTTVPGCGSQAAWILVDQASGERTILFQRDERLSHLPGELPRHGITSARALLVDGHATQANAEAARWAREAGIPVVADIDNLYPGHEDLLRTVDYLVGSHDLAQRLTGETELLKALPEVARRYRCALVAATLGRDGVLAFEEDIACFTYRPAYQVQTVDTTGAGDVFHGGLVFGLVQGWPLQRILDFSCAAAALNCTALGARGGICPLAEVERLMREGCAHPPHAAFVSYLR
jgi:sugar/nucleoside kinase (ribokinase family)